LIYDTGDVVGIILRTVASSP